MSMNNLDIVDKIINYLIQSKAEELENSIGLKSEEMPRMDQTLFLNGLTSKFKPGTLLLSYKYMKLTEQEWEHIRYLLQKKKEEQEEQLNEIKAKLWGNQQKISGKKKLTEEELK